MPYSTSISFIYCCRIVLFCNADFDSFFLQRGFWLILLQRTFFGAIINTVICIRIYATFDCYQCVYVVSLIAIIVHMESRTPYIIYISISPHSYVMYQFSMQYGSETTTYSNINNRLQLLFSKYKDIINIEYIEI